MQIAKKYFIPIISQIPQSMRKLQKMKSDQSIEPSLKRIVCSKKVTIEGVSFAEESNKVFLQTRSFRNNQETSRKSILRVMKRQVNNQQRSSIDGVKEYSAAVQQYFASSEEHQDNERFCTSDLISKFILLIIMMIVMVFFGVVTPNTFLGNRDPALRYQRIHPQTVKTTSVGTQKQTEKQLSFFEQQKLNLHQTHLQQHLSHTNIKQSPKMDLQSKQNNFLFRPKKRTTQMTVKQNIQDLYSFSKSMEQMVEEYLGSKNMQKNIHQEKKELYSSEQVCDGIRIMHVTHNVDFLGRLFIDYLSLKQNNIKSAQQKYLAMKKILSKQKQRYEEKYQISIHNQNELSFCILVNLQHSVQNRFYLRTLDSIFQQQYHNYHVVIIEDGAKDNLISQNVLQYLKQNQIPSNKYTLLSNIKKQGIAHNVYMAAHSYCDQDDIMMIVQDNQALVGRQVFALYNSLYQKHQAQIVYTQYLSVHQDQHIVIGQNTQIQPNLNSKRAQQVCQLQINSFKTDLLRKVKIQNLFDKEKNIFYSNDCAYTITALQMADLRIHFEPELTYQRRKFMEDDSINVKKQIKKILSFQPQDQLKSSKDGMSH